MSQTMRNQPITSVTVGDTVYVDLRYIKGHDVFDKLGLPDAYFVQYVCECKYVRWVGSGQKKIEAKFFFFINRPKLKVTKNRQAM